MRQNIPCKKTLRSKTALVSLNHRFNQFRGRRQPRACQHRAATPPRACLQLYCRCPPARSSTGFGYCSHFSTLEGRSKPLSGRRIPCLTSPERFLGPGRVKLNTSVAGIRRDAFQDCSIPSSCRHSDRHITVPPFEGQSQQSELLAFCGRSPLFDIRCLGRHFFFCFWGVKFIVSPGIICLSITF